MISTRSIKEKTYSEKEGELTMFDDVKKEEKLKKKATHQKQNYKLWEIKEKETHQKQNYKLWEIKEKETYQK